MNTNENIRDYTPEEAVVLGFASIETKGNGGSIEMLGDDPLPGISDA